MNIETELILKKSSPIKIADKLINSIDNRSCTKPISRVSNYPNFNN